MVVVVGDKGGGGRKGGGKVWEEGRMRWLAGFGLLLYGGLGIVEGCSANKGA